MASSTMQEIHPASTAVNKDDLMIPVSTASDILFKLQLTDVISADRLQSILYGNTFRQACCGPFYYQRFQNIGVCLP
jgi:hypothetical protein